ncbi:MAG TPA: hypothetical protein VGL61_03770 [Kofleriaceae bacterium]|jgi:hypothetical protein
MKQVAFVVALCACGSKGNAPIADAPPAPMDTFAFSVTGSIFDQNELPVGSAMVCVLDHPEIPCATSDANGEYVIGLPNLAGDDIAIQVTASNFIGEVLLEEEPATGVAWPTEIPLEMMADAIDELATGAGFTYPGSGGFLELRVMGGTAGVLTGATATLAPAAGAGPVYVGSDGTPDPSLVGTTGDGGILFGNVPAGIYEVTASPGSAGTTCTVSPSGALLVGDWPPEADGATTRVEVADASVTTNVNVICQ